MMKKNGESVTATALCPSAHLLSLCRQHLAPARSIPDSPEPRTLTKRAPFLGFMILSRVKYLQYSTLPTESSSVLQQPWSLCIERLHSTEPNRRRKVLTASIEF